MKRVVVTRFGGPEVLRIVDGPEPVPGPTEVTVRVTAAGVSFTDSLLRAGTYPGGPKPPFTPGYEVAGVVERVGVNCTARRPGDHVAALMVWGGNADVVCVPETVAVPVPDDIDPAVLVSLIFPYVTAFQLLHRATEVQAGQTVLYHGAAGRVGVALLELAKAAGATVYGTARGRDCGIVEELGGIPVDYTVRDFRAVARELPCRGVDVAIDGIGGSVTLRSFQALRPGGRLVLFGHQSTMVGGHRSWRRLVIFYGCAAVAMAWGMVSPRRDTVIYRIAKLRDRHPEWFAEDFATLIRLLRAGAINPAVGERIPLVEACRAHELLDGGSVTGKLVLIPD
jgi:NADPH2:quinone reductase